MIILPGQTVADASSPKDPAVLKRCGYVAIARYWRNTDAAEVARYHAAGLGVFLIHEWNATDADGGHAKGLRYGLQARQAADRIDYPDDVGMIACADQDSTPANIDTHVAYMDGFGTTYRTAQGCYGDRDLIDRVGAGMAVNWQASAAWWSRLRIGSRWIYPNSPLAHFRQSGDKFHIGVDHNVCLRAVRAWGPPTIPTPTEDDMPKVIRLDDGDPAQFVATGKQLTWITSRSERDALVFLGQAQLESDGTPFTWPRSALKHFVLVGPVPAKPSTVKATEFGAVA